MSEAPVQSSPTHSPYLPSRDRIFLRRLDSAPATASPFVIPDAAKEKPTECEVVAVSDRVYRTEYGITLPPPCAAGDHVLIGKYAGQEHRLVQADGKVLEVLVVRWDELLAVARQAGAEEGESK